MQVHVVHRGVAVAHQREPGALRHAGVGEPLAERPLRKPWIQGDGGDARYELMRRVETVYNESTAEGISSAMTAMFKAWSKNWNYLGISCASAEEI